MFNIHLILTASALFCNAEKYLSKVAEFTKLCRDGADTWDINWGYTSDNMGIDCTG